MVESMTTADPALQEVLGSLRALFEAEKEIAEEARLTHAGQCALSDRLGRLEGLLTDVLAGQAELRARLESLDERLAAGPPRVPQDRVG